MPDLKSGATVTVAEGDVFDYLRRQADHTSEGNETGQILQRRAEAGEAPQRR